MIWLIGNKGLLGNEIELLLKKSNFPYLATNRKCDITKFNILKKAVTNKTINWIINCAAYTNVESAEIEKKEASLVNIDGVRNISLLAKQLKTKVIHFSTDYVFPGKKKKGYNEQDPPAPLNYYGYTKAKGEEIISKYLKKYFIIRTSWLYGKYGNNFFSKIINLLKKKKILDVVEDQWGSPTYVVDLANFVMTVILEDINKYGIYHYSNKGFTNRYQFAVLIKELAEKNNLLNLNPQIRPISNDTYFSDIKRPAFSLLKTVKVEKLLKCPVPTWQSSLECYINSL